MQELGIKEAELARQTGLPQTTVNRLLLGETHDPRANTLKPIAQFFGVSVDQLLGLESLDKNRIVGTFNSFNKEAWSSVAIIEWEDVLSWRFTSEKFNINSHSQWIATERPVSKQSFAVISKPFLEPRFRKGSILIVDPAGHVRDGKFIIVSLDNKSVTLRQASIDGDVLYLKNIDAFIATIPFDKKSHLILGVVVEARIDLNF